MRGTSKMAAAFSAIETVQAVLSVLEEQYLVVGLLRDVLDRGLTVAIGSETGVAPLAECSLVVAPYLVDGQPVGSIGVLGPDPHEVPPGPGRGGGRQHPARGPVEQGLNASLQAAERRRPDGRPTRSFRRNVQTQKVRMADYYQLLQVPPDASAEDVKRAYRQLAREFHPDRNPDPAARERMAEINRAYEVLSDPERRVRYDRFGAEDEPPAASPAIPSAPAAASATSSTRSSAAPASAPARAARPVHPAGVDLEATVDLEFADAVFGTQTEVEGSHRRRLPRLRRHRRRARAPARSPASSAPAWARFAGSASRSSARWSRAARAPLRRASARSSQQRCPTCNGDGRTVDSRTYTVDVPAGVDSGTTLRLSRAGRGRPPGRRRRRPLRPPEGETA